MAVAFLLEIGFRFVDLQLGQLRPLAFRVGLGALEVLMGLFVVFQLGVAVRYQSKGLQVGPWLVTLPILMIGLLYLLRFREDFEGVLEAGYLIVAPAQRPQDVSVVELGRPDGGQP